MYKFYFSMKAAASCERMLPPGTIKHILIDDEWVQYTHYTTKQEPTGNWDDLEYLGEFDWESSSIKINGVIQ